MKTINAGSFFFWFFSCFFFFFLNDEAPVFSVFPFPFLSVFLSCIPLSVVLGVAVGMKKMMS
jgi:hypothetical protein